MELEALNPLEPQSSTKPRTTGTTTCRRAWYVASIASIASIFLLGLFGAGVTIKNHQLSGNVEALTGLATGSLCTYTDCVVNFLGRNDHLTCSGAANSPECIETCCTEELHCTDLGAGYCTGLGFRNREVTLLDRGLRLRTGTCKGEQNCKDACCQRSCADVPCDPGRCKRPFPPEKCTDSTCQEQCCYHPDKYCGFGLNAWTEACRQCEDKTEYCEVALGGVDRSQISRHEWNRLVFEKMDSGALVPGCEEDTSPRCQDNLKYRLISIFWLHRTAEGVSANTVAILPGGTEALSGGDDGQVWQWRLSDGKPLKNFTSDIEPILQVAPLNDATYFCSATRTEAAIWLLQLRDGLEIKGKSELPEDKRKGTTTPNNTACIGVNTWETVIVGQDNSFAVIWHWKLERTMTVPWDPTLAWIQQIETDAGYHQWPKWDKNDKLQTAFTNWRKHLFGLDEKYDARRLEVNASDSSKSSKPTSEATANLRRLKRSSGPWPNWFSNIRWGDIPMWYYAPNNWGEVVSLAAIPSNLYFVVGYEYGSIRIWKTYNGFIQAVIPKAHAGRVNALMPAPAGDVFWSGGDDGWIREWEAGSGKALRSHYAVFAGQVEALAMIPGGNGFYSGHSDGVVLFWLVAETEWPLCHLDPEGGVVNSLDVNPGKIGQVAVALENGLVKVYEQR